jgi:hypothetical protein
VIALAGGVVHKVDSGYLIAAGALFLILIGFSTIYSSLRPYRIMLAEDPRGGNEPERTIGATVNSRLPEKRWLEERISQEQRLYGPLRTSQRTWPTLKPKDLQQAFDVERWVFVIVQLLFAAIILVLVAGLAFD